MLKNYLFSVTDKALYDALNTSKITNSELRGLFLSRGVITSIDTSREELAEVFSKYNHDYYDHQKIANAMGVITHKEKVTSTVYKTDVSKDNLEDCIDKLKCKINKENDLCLWSEDNGIITVDITYQTVDYTKSEFKQVVKKEATLTIEVTDSGYNIRYPLNTTVEKYEEFLRLELEKVSENDGLSFDYENINLFTVDDPQLRTKFFIDILNKMEGYKLKDVTDVYVYHPKPDKEEDGSEIHISRASLKGAGVLKSGEIQELYDRGFYISKIRWQFTDKLIDSDIYEAVAQFGDPEKFILFSYLVKGKYKYKGKEKYTKNIVKLLPDEEILITKAIEKTAKLVSNDIIIEANKEDEDESSKSEAFSSAS
jgi:hypothetical protein